MKKYVTKNIQETHNLASKVLKELVKGMPLCLSGQLGAGKTTFTQGIALAMGIPQKFIKSPTYTYVREVEWEGKKIFHCDLYRLEGKPHAANEIIAELLCRPHDLLIIEWAEHLGDHTPKNRTSVNLKVKNETVREVTVHHHGKKSS